MDAKGITPMKLLRYFLNSIKDRIEKYADCSAQLTLPVLSKEIVRSIALQCADVFRQESVQLVLQSPCVIVGDLHGQILDLYRIIEKNGLPDKTRYIYLGDLVDRGEFSLETVTMVFLMKLIWPQRVHIIRGNHEFNYLCTQGGFSTQLAAYYHDTSVLDAFLQAFSYIPISAIIDNVILCVHGGLGPGVFSLSQIRKLNRPIHTFGSDILDPILWSDPSEETEYYEPSPRGTGYLFGEAALTEFLEANKLAVMIRGHECVMNGCEQHFGGKLYTVFSASNYCGQSRNSSASLYVKNTSTFEIQTYPFLSYLRRSSVLFHPIGKTPRVRPSQSISPLIIPPSVPPLSGPSPRPRGFNRHKVLQQHASRANCGSTKSYV